MTDQQDLVSQGIRGNDFEVGEVLNTAVKVLWRNGLSFGAVVLLVFAPYMAGSFLLLELFDTTSLDTLESPAFWGSLIGIVLLGLALYYFITVVLTYGTFKDLSGQPAGIGECLAIGITRLPSTVLLSIILGLIYLVGLLFLIVPAIYFAVIFALAVPVLVAEKRGVADVFDCLGRSAELTRGYRWPILGLLAILFGLNWLADSILSVLDVLLGEGLWPLSFGLSVITDSALFAFSAVVSVVAYYNLRMVKDGLSSEQLAAVFD